MPDSRVDRFLASTAMALLLVSSGATLTTAANAASTAASDVQTDKAPPPAVSEFAPKPATDTSAKPDDTPAAADAKPASDVKPSGNTKPASAAENQPAPPVEAKPVETPAEKTADKPADAAPAPSAANPAASGPDAAITEQLRELANGKFDRLFANKKDRPQIEAFYSNRNYAPLWIADGKANARATAAIAYLRHVDADGLDPADYPLPNFKASSASPDLADAEIILTEAVITYAHHASVGRVHWSRVSADIEYAIPAAEPGDVLAALASASDIAATLDSYEPQTPGYRALKAKLADIRSGKIDKGKPPIAKGPVLKVGMQDERVPELRERLGVAGNGNTYDKPLVDAVKKFQEQHDLVGSGMLSVGTVEALNGRTQPDRVTEVIIANMERWRWMPHHFPDTYVIVNLPDFTLRVMHDGKQAWMTRIVIGKPEMPTPIMTADMKFITINPTWNVPPSIVHREYLPALAQ